MRKTVEYFYLEAVAMDLEIVGSSEEFLCIYYSIEYDVRVGMYVSEWFPVNVGLRQHCVDVYGCLMCIRMVQCLIWVKEWMLVECVCNLTLHDVTIHHGGRVMAYDYIIIILTCSMTAKCYAKSIAGINCCSECCVLL